MWSYRVCDLRGGSSRTYGARYLRRIRSGTGVGTRDPRGEAPLDRTLALWLSAHPHAAWSLARKPGRCPRLFAGCLGSRARRGRGHVLWSGLGHSVRLTPPRTLLGIGARLFECAGRDKPHYLTTVPERLI